MFFVAFFGVQDKKKELGSASNLICSLCGHISEGTVYKVYRYFHLFFIPIARWNIRYLVRMSCCGAIYELEPLVGKNFEKDPEQDIKSEDFCPLEYQSYGKHCEHCRTSVPGEYKYCPYCGEKL